ncbi:transcription termination factor 4, mitochondrial [Panulirus ornatus]|uniref:transcription termination factor 4, mitochondrial n=1 Tax=Panulirus ornatus TaxID=150431 RepID=UPI003A8AB8BE
MALKLMNALSLWIKVTASSSHLGINFPSSNSYYLKLSHQRVLLYCSYSEGQVGSNNEVDFVARTRNILQAVHSKEISGSGYSEKEVASLYEFLMNLGIKSETIEAQFLETPDILKYPLYKWNEACEVMEENGLSSSRILQNVALCPEILKIKSSSLSDKLVQYRQIALGKDSFLSLLNRYPVLFLCQPHQIKKRVMLLRSIFPPPIFKPLIVNNPNILVENWEDVMEKIMYIHKVMGLEQPQLAFSKTLRRSLLHIKIRHQFLFRAGLYITPNLEKDRRSHLRNASLSDIMDTSDTYFANRVARLTDHEYKVFSSIMEEEESGYSDSEESDVDENPSLGFDEVS